MVSLRRGALGLAREAARAGVAEGEAVPASLEGGVAERVVSVASTLWVACVACGCVCVRVSELQM